VIRNDHVGYFVWNLCQVRVALDAQLTGALASDGVDLHANASGALQRSKKIAASAPKIDYGVCGPNEMTELVRVDLPVDSSKAVLPAEVLPAFLAQVMV
jgi:hypothetical protein